VRKVTSAPRVVPAELRATQPERFAREALDQVARDRPRRLFLADHETEPRFVSRRLAVQDEMRRASPGAQTKNG